MKTANKQALLWALTGGVVGGLIVGASLLLLTNRGKHPLQHTATHPPQTMLTSTTTPATQLPDFRFAAKMTRPSVVHVRCERQETVMIPHGFNPFPYWGDEFWWFERRQYPRHSYGSGVIVSSNGYIVTNYHVVDGAERIIVTLYDKREYQAELVGYDRSTDLALLKIEATDLPSIVYGNSDEVEVGEWVLAVGNPFNLESTVTAGIVSAKGRNLHIIKGRYALRSFIQTDAAVNPGNSGGALVNLRGELIGITVAIATPTGAYAGYAFAVPSNIVRKVVADIVTYGKVKRSYLGVFFREVDSEVAKKLGMDASHGAYIDSVIEGSAAWQAGIRPGDVIIAINDKKLETASDLQEKIAQYSPGDRITITYWRNGKTYTTEATLQNTENALSSDANALIRDLLGIEVEPTKDGLRVTQVFREGRVAAFTGIKPGFVITEVNGRKVRSVEDMADELANANRVLIKGFDPRTRFIYQYAFTL